MSSPNTKITYCEIVIVSEIANQLKDFFETYRESHFSEYLPSLKSSLLNESLSFVPESGASVPDVSCWSLNFGHAQLPVGEWYEFFYNVLVKNFETFRESYSYRVEDDTLVLIF